MNPVRKYTEAQLLEESVQAKEISDPAPEPVLPVVVSGGDHGLISELPVCVQQINATNTSTVLVTPEVVITPPDQEAMSESAKRA